jgi:NADH:ubiquinone oxidoreductase subunit 6 (subunit J)
VATTLPDSPVTLSFAIIAAVTVAAAVAAMGLRNLVHCVLALAVTFGGLAAVYLQLDAQFVGFAQLLVYVGAVSILIVFAILLTRGAEPPQQPAVSPGWMAGILVALAVLGVLAYALCRSTLLTRDIPPPPEAAVVDLGTVLMSKYVLPLEAMGLLLTAALIGAVIIAMKEEGDGGRGAAGGRGPGPATHGTEGTHEARQIQTE